MSLTVVDTTVLSNFARTDAPLLVTDAFPDVGAPMEVLSELRRGQELGLLPPMGWDWLPILRTSAAEARQAKRLRQRLDRGEAGCLAITVSRGGLLLTDDRAARRVAHDLAVAVSGTLGVLARLTKLGHLSTAEADALLQRMIKSGYWSPVSSLRDL